MIRILGPGCPPAPTRIPIADRDQVLILAVELHEGAPVWVMDTAAKAVIKADMLAGARYPGIYQFVRKGEKVRLDCGCRAGRSCARHNAADALRWWTEATRRDVVREWAPDVQAGQRLAYDAERPPVCVTREHAEREARRLGRPCVVLRDGWYREIERWEVASE